MPQQIIVIRAAIQSLHPNWVVTPESNAFKEFKRFSITVNHLPRQTALGSLNDPEISPVNIPDSLNSPWPEPTVCYEYLLYFKLHSVPESYCYIQSKHQKLFMRFSSVLINILIQEFQHNYKQRIYLVRSQQNYIPISEIKKSDLKRTEIQQFTIRVIMFFSRVLEINREAKIRITINKHTVCLDQNKEFKLGDYDMFFYHHSQRGAVGSEQEILQQMTKLVCYILLKKDESEFQIQEEFGRGYKGKAMERIIQSDEEERTCAQRIIYSFVEEKVIRHELIERYFKEQQYLADISTSEEHCLDVTTRSEISLPLNFSVSHEYPLASFQSSINKKYKSRSKSNTKPWRTCLVLIMIVALIGGMIAILVFKASQCGQHEYKEGNTCYECHASCVKCKQGGGESCTQCTKDEWLVVTKQINDRGKCARECQGIKDEVSKRCLVALKTGV